MTGLDLVSVFCRLIPLFPATFVEKAVFSPLCVFGIFVKNNEGVAVWIHIQVLYSAPLVFIPVSCQYHAVFIAMVP
jgi:hypothetical protein